MKAATMSFGLLFKKLHSSNLETSQEFSTAKVVSNTSNLEGEDGNYVCLLGNAYSLTEDDYLKSGTSQANTIVRRKYELMKKTRKTEAEPWVQQTTVESDQTLSGKGLFTADTSTNPKVWIQDIDYNDLHLPQTVNELEAPNASETVQNNLSETVKIAGRKHEEWALTKGTPLVVVGKLEKESNFGNVHWKISRFGDKPFVTTTDSLDKVKQRYASHNFFHYCYLGSLGLGGLMTVLGVIGFVTGKK